MTIKTITFQQTFPTGNFQNQKLGIEISLSPEETAMDHQVISHYEFAKKLVNESFKALNPDLTPSLSDYNTGEQAEWKARHTERPAKSKEDTVNHFVKDIENCMILDEQNALGVQIGLLSYQHLCSIDPLIEAAYNKRLEELSK